MQKFNYHTHTKRCGHAFGDDEQFVKAAISAGYTTLGFSDHVPFPGKKCPGGHMDYEELPEYLASIRKLAVKYSDKINIKVGFEIEFYDEYMEYYESLRKVSDFLLLGQHNEALYINDYCFFCDDEDVMIYALSIKKAIDGKFADLICHPDYFMLGRRDWTEACEKASRIICETSIKNDIPIEVNLNGIRHGKFLIDGQMQYAYPYRRFWEIAAEYGCKVVYGVDAHLPMTFLDKTRYDTVNEVLVDLPLNYIDLTF